MATRVKPPVRQKADHDRGSYSSPKGVRLPQRGSSLPLLAFALGVVVMATAACASLATGVLAVEVAQAHRGDGVFTLVKDRRLSNGWYGPDIAMLPDGSIVGVMHARGWLMTPAGVRHPLPELGGTGVAATADGGVVVLQGEGTEPFSGAFNKPAVGEHRIVRWAPGEGVSVLAGTGVRGLAGDGGPALEALLDLRPTRRASSPTSIVSPTGIVSLPDRGFAFVDVGNRRIRAVDAAGTIHTIAGADGSLRDPVGLARMPDGGWLVAEAGWPGSIRTVVGRVRRIAPGGVVTTVTTLGAGDLVMLPDGRSVLAASSFSGQLWQLAPGTSVPVPYLSAGSATRTFDFAARTYRADRLALDPYGGLLAANAGEVTYVPRGPTPWTLVALRDTRPAAGGVRAVIESTRPGNATLEIVRDERVVARLSQPVPAGHSVLTASVPIRSDWYDVRIALQGQSGVIARDEVPLHGAPRLTIPLARELLGRRQGYGEGYRQGSDEEHLYRYRLGDCRLFSGRRVDCAVIDQYGMEQGAVALTRSRTGVVLRRHYSWNDAGIRRHPKFHELFGVLRLSRVVRGKWSNG